MVDIQAQILQSQSDFFDDLRGQAFLFGFFDDFLPGLEFLLVRNYFGFDAFFNVLQLLWSVLVISLASQEHLWYNTVT